MRPAVQHRPGFQAVRAFRPPDGQCCGLDRDNRVPEGQGAVVDADMADRQRRQRAQQRAVEGDVDAGKLQPFNLEVACQERPGVQHSLHLPHLDVDGRDPGNRQFGPRQEVEPDRAVQRNLASQRIADKRLQMRPVQGARTLPCDCRQARCRQHHDHRDKGKSAHRAPAVVGSGSAKTATYTMRRGRWRRSSI